MLSCADRWELGPWMKGRPEAVAVWRAGVRTGVMQVETCRGHAGGNLVRGEAGGGVLQGEGQ